MRRLTKLRRTAIIVLIAIVVSFAVWLYWNRIQSANLTALAPADSLAYIEVNDLSNLSQGVERVTAWQSLAPLLDAPANLAPSPWVVRLARWTGIGTADAILFARSQIAVVFTGAEGTQTGS